MKLVRQHVLAFITVAIVGLAVVWARRDPVEIYDTAVADQAKAGGALRVTRFGKFLRGDCSRTISIWIVDAQGTTWSRIAETTGRAVNMQVSSISREIPVPFSAAWGRAQFLQQISYACFPFGDLWPIVVDMPTTTFTIAPP